MIGLSFVVISDPSCRRFRAMSPVTIYPNSASQEGRTFQEGPSRKIVLKRDTRTSRKSELGCFLSSIDWSVVVEVPNCEAKLVLFADTIKTGLEDIMPSPVIPHGLLRSSRPSLSSNSKLSTEVTKITIIITAIKSNMRGNHSKGGIKIINLKNNKPSQWWHAVKRIAGMTPASASDCVLFNLCCADRFEYCTRVISKSLMPLTLHFWRL